MIYLILVIIIIIVSTIAIFVIKSLMKEKKALQFKLEYLDKRIDWLQKNRHAYHAIIDKIAEGKNVSEKTKEKIYSTDGSNLDDILNEL